MYSRSVGARAFQQRLKLVNDGGCPPAQTWTRQDAYALVSIGRMLLPHEPEPAPIGRRQISAALSSLGSAVLQGNYAEAIPIVRAFA